MQPFAPFLCERSHNGLASSGQPKKTLVNEDNHRRYRRSIAHLTNHGFTRIKG
jgi:hypothetical protein